MEIDRRLQMSNQQVGPPRWRSGKEFCQRERLRLNPWVGKIPWSRKWQLAPVFLPGKFHGQMSLLGCSLWSWKESATTELTHTQSTGYWSKTANLSMGHIWRTQLSPLLNIQLGINDAYLVSPLIRLQGNQSHIFWQICSFLISLSQWVTPSAIQLYKARNSEVTWPSPRLPPLYLIQYQVLQSYLPNLSHRGQFLSASTTTLFHHLLPTQLLWRACTPFFCQMHSSHSTPSINKHFWETYFVLW